MSGMIPNEMINEMLEKAVYQQLFMGNDQIMGRMPQNTMHFKNIGYLLSEFIQRIKERIHLLTIDDFDRFLSDFEEIFQLSLDETRDRVSKNFEGMGDLTGQEVVVIYMVLTKLLENVREQAYLKYGIGRLEQEYKIATNKPFNEKIKDHLHLLGARGDDKMSLLYNLCFIRLLAEVYNESGILTNAKRQISKKINLIIKEIS